ncbi:hypothetical protein [Paenibacillus sp. 32352]|uniref:hypothetical protein n=1 Tax=Paenibacillus sp. 32352 TaxID=1969111 RepID=UPI0009AD99A1|nr:hypothetical protein [Paenibacillus sp. 32352]
MAKKTRARRANVTIDGSSNLPDIVNKLRKLAEKEVYIGSMGGDEDLAITSAVLEYGSIKGNIPARSYIGSGKRRATPIISKVAKAGVQKVIDGNMQPEKLLQEIGEKGQERVLKNFDKIRTPPLSPIYAKQKGTNKLLVLEEDLRDSISYVVMPKGRGNNQ